MVGSWFCIPVPVFFPGLCFLVSGVWLLVSGFRFTVYFSAVYRVSEIAHHTCYRFLVPGFWFPENACLERLSENDSRLLVS